MTPRHLLALSLMAVVTTMLLPSGLAASPLATPGDLALPDAPITLLPVADAYISSANPSQNYGTVTILYAGSLTSGSIERALFRFELGSIPPGSIVENASFQAYLVKGSPSPAVLDVELKRVDVSWDEGSVTWKTLLTYTGASLVLGVGTASAYYAWDVTGLVQSWVAGAPNRGLALMSKNEGTPGYRGFASRESVSPAYPPRLIITLKAPTPTSTSTRTSMPTSTGTRTSTPTMTGTRTSTPTMT
jgi:opacity protein-like surface antigen